MFKRFISLISALVLSITISSCGSSGVNTQNGKGDVVSPQAKGQKKEINIMVYKYMYDQMTIFTKLNDYALTFERELGVKVNFISFGNPKYVSYKDGAMTVNLIDESWKDDFFNELNVKLYAKDGPELILIADDIPTSSLIRQGAVLNVKDKISNLKKVYPGLIDEQTCYVPIGMRYVATTLNGKVLNELNIGKPSFNWTRDDYLKIRDKWLAKEPVKFSNSDYYDVIFDGINSLNIYDSVNNKVNLSTPSVIEGIQNIRNEIYSGKYTLNKDYNYSNYYNMFFDVTSEEFTENRSMDDTPSFQKGLRMASIANGFRAVDVSNRLKTAGEVIMPNFKKSEALQTWGFVVNRNGKNNDLALEFVNGLLSNEVQKSVFESGHSMYYPVNAEIEGEIKNLEAKTELDKGATDLKDYALAQVKTPGFYNPSASIVYDKLFKMIRKDLFKFIFREDPYPTDQLTKELKDLENKCNIYLNE